MDPWKALAGEWRGEIIDVFGGAVWTVELEIEVGWSGRATGKGVLKSLLMEGEVQPVKVKGSGSAGKLVLLLSAPDRFGTGVCWQHEVTHDPEQDALAGAGFSFESPVPDDPEVGEPGSLRLSRARG